MSGEELVKIIEFKDIGEVSFIRKPSVRNLKIIVRPLKGVQVSVPRYISFESAGKFVEEKRSWIRKSQLKFSRYKNAISSFAEKSTFTTRDHQLVLKRHAKATLHTVIRNGLITVSFPEFAEVTDPRIQKCIRKAILQAWRIEAARHLPEMTRKLAEKFRLTYNRITVRDNKTRWGSCSRGNNISLNIHLMRLPQHLTEYVILHELNHTIHKHHQKAFWQNLDLLTDGKARQLDKELNKYIPEVW
jgi:predicted metal-dependent hydrolase